MKARKQKLIKSGLQMRLIMAFLALGIVAALFQVLLLNYSVMEMARDMAVESDQLMARLAGILTRNLLITLGVLTPLMLTFGVLITFRVAGPIWRFERYLESVARGEEIGPCGIRKRDELHDLCDRINAAVEYLRSQGEDSSEESSETIPDSFPPRAA